LICPECGYDSFDEHATFIVKYGMCKPCKRAKKFEEHTDVYGLLPKLPYGNDENDISYS